MSENTNLIVLNNSRKYLQWQFAWPKKESDNKSFMIHALIVCLTAPLLVGSLAHIIVEMYAKNGAKIDMDISILISITGVSYFNVCFVLNIADITEVCRMLSDLKIFGKPKNFDTINSRSNRYSKIHCVVIHLTFLIYMLTPYSEYQQCQKWNQEKNLKEVCGLIPLWLPFDIDYFPAKQIVFLIQALASKYSYITASMMTVFTWECSEHLVVRMRHVSEKFVEALNQKSNEKRRNHLNKAIEYNNYVLRCADLMINSFASSTFVHILQTGMLLGCLGYQLTKSPHMMTCAILGGYINSFILISVAGEKLSQESLGIGSSIYHHTRWYNLEVDIQKDLIFVLLRSKKPVYIKAGPYAVMTHRSILSVLKTAYSVLSLLEAISLG